MLAVIHARRISHQHPERMVHKAMFRQYVAAVTGSISIMMNGTTLGWITPLLVHLLSRNSEVPMTRAQSSWVVSLISIGELFTPIPAGILVDIWGRKPCLIITAPMYIISWILVLATRSVPVLYAVRIIQGLGMGIIFTVLPMYIAEIAGPTIRGSLTTLFQGMWYFGILFEYSIGPYVTYDHYAYISATIPVIFLLTFSWMPESPYFLLMRNREEDALEALTWLRAEDNFTIQQELLVMKQSVREEMLNKVSWKDLWATPADRRALLIIQVLAVSKFLSGAEAILSYVSQTFSATRGSCLTADNYTIIIGVLIILTTFLTSGLADTMGRRPLLLLSCIGSGISEFLAGLYYYLDAETTIGISSYSWLSFVSIASYCVFLSIGIGPLCSTIQAELFPSNTRGLASGLTNITITATSFISMKMYQVISDSVGIYLNYWIFSAFCALGAVVILLFMPETKGKTFAEIQKEFREINNKDEHNFVIPKINIIGPDSIKVT